MDWQRVLLGIGNPGPDYHETRHNAGFMVLDLLADRLGLDFRRLERKGPDGVKRFGGKVKAQIATGTGADGVPFVLVKPLTYVNLSGDVAGPLLRVRELTPESLFVVLDDLNLPLGRIRIRPSGSSGGHNGLRSIEAAVTPEYPRLRLGIGESVETSVVDHVLAPFTPGERQVLVPSLHRAADACQAWLDGVEVPSLMTTYNGSGPSESTDSGTPNNPENGNLEP